MRGRDSGPQFLAHDSLSDPYPIVTTPLSLRLVHVQNTGRQTAANMHSFTVVPQAEGDPLCASPAAIEEFVRSLRGISAVTCSVAIEYLGCGGLPG